MAFIDTWDSGAFGADWDSGLQWDVNTGPSPGDVTPYLDLITSEHRDRPKFIAMISAVLQPLCDDLVILGGLPFLFDLDVAIGSQEDIVGEWVGVTRNVTVPLENVYFSLDSEPLGLDFGSMQGPNDPTTGLIVLPDEAYRTLLRARVAANQWDGTIPGAYTAWDTLFAGTGFGILIQDLGGMHMIYALTGPVPDAVTLAMFNSGLLNMKPAGVRIDLFITPAISDTPYFGLDMENDAIAGLDVGAFGIESPGI